MWEKIRTFLEFLEWNMGYLERNSETWKTPGFSGFECRVSGIGRVSIFGFGSGSGSKKVGLFPRVSGFRVQRPITSLVRLKVSWDMTHRPIAFEDTILVIATVFARENSKVLQFFHTKELKWYSLKTSRMKKRWKNLIFGSGLERDIREIWKKKSTVNK